MGKKVYVVTSGWSSDYKVEGVFSTKENAEKYVLVFGEKDDSFSIDEWEVDEYFNNRIQAYIIGGTPIIEMSFSTDKIESIKKIATERLMQIKALEQIKFPHLFRKVVLGACPTLPNISEDRRNKHYPVYDFNTGHIWLEDGQDLKTGIKSTTEIIKR